MEKLGLQDAETIECIQGDAAEVKKELDKYNWFYFFDPFDDFIMFQCIDNLCDSFKRHGRKMHIVNINPRYHDYIENTGFFRLTNQFLTNTRQKVVSVFETYDD
jgi:hypothetical protein